MKVFQNVNGAFATTVYANANKSYITRMNVKTGAERIIASAKNVDVEDFIKQAQVKYGSMYEVNASEKTAGLHLVKKYDWNDVIAEPSRKIKNVWVDNNYPDEPPHMASHVFIEYEDGTYDLIDDSGEEQHFNSKADAADVFPEAVTVSRNASRSFRTARRKLTAQERLRLIDEDKDDEDFDL